MLRARVTDGSRPRIDQSADLISLSFLPSCRIISDFPRFPSFFLLWSGRASPNPFFFPPFSGYVAARRGGPVIAQLCCTYSCPVVSGLPRTSAGRGAWPRAGCCALIGGARERKSRKTGEGGARCNGTKVGTFAASRKLCPGSFLEPSPRLGVEGKQMLAPFPGALFTSGRGSVINHE